MSIKKYYEIIKIDTCIEILPSAVSFMTIIIINYIIIYNLINVSI